MAAESPVNGLDQTRQIGLSDRGGAFQVLTATHLHGDEKAQEYPSL